MTTYTLTGLAVYRSIANDAVVGVDNSNITLDLVVSESTTSLSYTVNPPQPGDEPGDETVEIALDAYTVRLNGGPEPSGEDGVFQVGWKDAANVSHSSTALVVNITTNVPGLGLVDADYIFLIAGDALPSITTPAQWAAFEASITSIGVPTGAYGPNTAIALTSLGATVSEDDIITGGPGKDVFRGGLGDDTINGLGGNDRLFGGDGDDRLFGGNGNDFLNPGDNTGFDIINTGAGKDKVVLSDIVTGYVGLEHSDLDARIIVNIDGNANTGTINKVGNGLTTIIDVKNPMQADPLGLYGLGVSGTAFNDTFNVTVVDGGWMQIRGGAGKDKYVIGTSTGTGVVRLNFDDATGGVTVNLKTGKVRDDGFGNTEFITGTGKIWEVRASMQDDKITGSANDESFILMAGTDTLNGGAGFDRVRYDRNGVDGVQVDLDTGLAFGTWNGVAFDHALSNIEHVRGSNGDDLIFGSNTGDDRLEGRDGNDEVNGGRGNDTLSGGRGKDKLLGGKGDDLLQGEGGNDNLKGEQGKDRLEGGDGKDRLDGGGGNDRLLGGKGNDKMIGGGGNDTMTGGRGNDTFVFGTGVDGITDFNAANNREKIDLSGVSAITGFNTLKNNFLTDLAGNVVIDDGAGNTLTLLGLSISDLDRGDFIF